MQKGLQELVSIIAEHTNTNHGRVAQIARRGQEVQLFPKAVGSHVPACGIYHAALLLFGTLSGELLCDVSAAAKRIAEFKSTRPGENITAGEYVGAMLQHLRDIDPRNPGDQARLAFKSSITIVGGDNPALVIRYSCTDEPLELSFTPSGMPYDPEWSTSVARATILPGRLLFRIGTSLGNAFPVSVPEAWVTA